MEIKLQRIEYNGYILATDRRVEHCYIERIADGELIFDSCGGEVATTPKKFFDWAKEQIDSESFSVS